MFKFLYFLIYNFCLENMPKNFKTGDSVVLKSGNKIMTVDYLNKTGLYSCRWYEGMILKEGAFNPEDLLLKNRKNV